MRLLACAVLDQAKAFLFAERRSLLQSRTLLDAIEHSSNISRLGKFADCYFELCAALDQQAAAAAAAAATAATTAASPATASTKTKSRSPQRSSQSR